jgi:hypothetical protein
MSLEIVRCKVGGVLLKGTVNLFMDNVEKIDLCIIHRGYIKHLL